MTPSQPIEPTYRIVAVPVSPAENLIATANEDIWMTLRKPPEPRNDGFGFRGVDAVKRIQGGCTGTGYAQQSVTVLKNGLVELTAPLLNRHFQWYKEERGFASMNWLFPFAVAEMPLSFLLLAMKLFHRSGYHRNFIVQQDYYAVKHFVLVPGHPAATGFGMFKDEIVPYGDKNIVGDKHTLSVLDSAWAGYRSLVLEAYQAFGLTEKDVPRLRELEGYPFDFDYMHFGARYRYSESGIVIDILNEYGRCTWWHEVPSDGYSDEIDAIRLGISAYKREVKTRGKHPDPARNTEAK